MARIATQLMEAGDKSVLSVSDCTPEEIFGLSFMLSLAKKIDSEIMTEWVTDFLKLRISRLRLGRKELILLGAGASQWDKNRKGSVGDLFAGFSNR